MRELDEEKAWQEQRRRRVEEARYEKEKQLKMRKRMKMVLPFAGVLLIGSIVFSFARGISHKAEVPNEIKENREETQPEQAYTLDKPVEEQAKEETPSDVTAIEPVLPSRERFQSMLSANTKALGEDVLSEYAVLLDAETGEILENREGMTRMNPASMTKMLTILVAAEQNPNLDDYVTITRDITDYSFVNDCSAVGFEENEKVPVRDLFYGTILPSGGDAAAALAIYTAGSLDAFVALMNEKLEKLGLSETSHMTNCVGLYDENHYSTAYDMALILQAAIENELCREALTKHIYTTAATTEHPEGITVSNWFLRRIEDKETNGEVLYAKTGYVTQSGSCAASYQLADDGKEYICVTGNAHSSWRAIYDHVAMYLMCTEV